MTSKILVYGWYHHQNIGDDLFIEAFQILFPEFIFNFTNLITQEQLSNCDAVFLGGGSFLDSSVRIEPGLWYELEKKKIFYIGVGIETEIHPDHAKLLRKSSLVAFRNEENLDIPYVERYIQIPDLVYILPSRQNSSIQKSLLFLPNIICSPQWNSSHWEHVAWSYFKSECAQFLDNMIEQGFNVRFYPMCKSDKLDDSWAAAEIVSSMIHREKNLLSVSLSKPIIDEFSSYSIIVTQRFHGRILADLAGTPSIAIAHHDKLKTNGFVVPYFGITKKILFDAVQNALDSSRVETKDPQNLFKMSNLVRGILR